MKNRGVPRRYAGAILVVAIAVNALMAWTANLGGQISHPEIRSGDETIETVDVYRTEDSDEHPND